MIYLIITLLLFGLSVHFDIHGAYKNKELWCRIILISFICLAGLRYRIGIDTVAFVYGFFHETPKLSDVFTTLNLTEYPLWRLLNSIVYSFGGKFFIIQFIESAFVNVLVFKYIKRHCRYIFTCLFLYFIWLYPGYNFEEMKQSFAVVLCLFANDYIIDRRYLKGIFLFFIAILFHFAAIIVVIFSLFAFFRFDWKGVLFILSAFVIGSIIQYNFEDYLIIFGFDDFIQSKAEDYFESDRFFAITGKNFKFFILNLLPTFISSLAILSLKKKNNSCELMRLEPYFVLCLFFMILSMRIAIIYRYVNFYAIYVILFVSQCFVEAFHSGRKTEKVRNTILSVLFVLVILSGYFGIKGENDRYHKFYPYHSIIDKQTDKMRERVFSQHSYDGKVHPPRDDEY